MELNLINIAYIESVAGGDMEIMMEIINIFKSQVPEFITEMKDLLNKKEFLQLGLLAHKAKSSISIMGMEDLAIMLKDFELNAKKGINQDEYSSFISRFENDTADAITELDRYLKNFKK